MLTETTTTENETTRLLVSNNDDEDKMSYMNEEDVETNGAPYDESFDSEVFLRNNPNFSQSINVEAEKDEKITGSQWLMLALLAMAPWGIEFFKSGQSHFQLYLMNDPKILMNATKYGIMLTLMSMPIVPLLSGVILDREAKQSEDNDNDDADAFIEEPVTSNTNNNSPSMRRSRSRSYALIGFQLLTLLGILLYGIGMVLVHSVPIGFFGAAVFGIGEGCVKVAARTFIGHAFCKGKYGAFAQGVLISSSSLSVIAAKNSIPWLVENNNNSSNDDDDDNYSINDIWIAIEMLVFAQLLSLTASIVYTWQYGLSEEQILTNSQHSVIPLSSGPGGPLFGFMESMFQLPSTFWIVAVGRAIFLVTFKVYSRYSNSYLIEKLGKDAVAAGHLSSVHELFALLSPLVGYLAYESPGGIISFAIGGAVIGSLSIGALCFLDSIPVLVPLLGISAAHGIIIPLAIAMIPHTVPSAQLGMAFAVFEVLGSTLMSLMVIFFGWLRDLTGDYGAAMHLLLAMAIVGTTFLCLSKKRLGLIGAREIDLEVASILIRQSLPECKN